MGIDAGARRAVFLDRDGVINRATIRDGRPHPPATVDEFELLPGVPEALRRLKAEEYLLIVVTNQPDVARGLVRRETVDAIHARLAAALPVDDIRCCDHDDGDGCSCRKPRPGMLLDAAAAHGVDLGASVMVGDRWRDVEAGRRAGCATVLVDYAYAEPGAAPDAVVGSLLEAADWILARDGVRAASPAVQETPQR
jgi:D-glycero-D-manno-heptose 1,7-bisphosphate phosphatase